MLVQRQFNVATGGRHTYDITGSVRELLAAAELSNGLCNIFIRHTSASLIICENADPAVRRDLETFMSGLARDGDPRFSHVQEGPDDMSAHIRSVLTQTALTLPVTDGDLPLGTWQGIYLWEHRTSPHQRSVLVTLYGE